MTMTEINPAPISFDEFSKFLADVLLIEVERITPQASFVVDLCVDSLRWAEMALRMCKLGVEIPTEVFWEIQTVGDAYQVYLKHAAATPSWSRGQRQP